MRELMDGVQRKVCEMREENRRLRARCGGRSGMGVVRGVHGMGTGMRYAGCGGRRRGIPGCDCYTTDDEDFEDEEWWF